jgi:hypothetical protein
MKDGRIIDINTNKTPVVGSEFSLLKELFVGAGQTPDRLLNSAKH